MELVKSETKYTYEMSSTERLALLGLIGQVIAGKPITIIDDTSLELLNGLYKALRK